MRDRSCLTCYTNHPYKLEIIQSCWISTLAEEYLSIYIPKNHSLPYLARYTLHTSRGSITITISSTHLYSIIDRLRPTHLTIDRAPIFHVLQMYTLRLIVR